jgi:uncharacterized protein (TIGR02246 family)
MSAVQSITAAERLAIESRMRRYARAMDRGDAAGVAACFAPQGLVVTAAGERFEGRAGAYRFAARAMRGPIFRGRQHHIQPLSVQRTATGCEAVSYYQVLASQSGQAPYVLSLGWYADQFVERDGQWLFARKTLNRWNAALAPRGVPLPPSSPIVGRGVPSPGEPAPEDRIVMEDLMRAYATALDLGDVPAMQAVFWPDATLVSGALGPLHGPDGVRAFLLNSIRQPGFAGRQHRIHPLTFEAAGETWRAFSYWTVETWHEGARPAVVALGYYEDAFARRGGEWRFLRKRIARWDSATAPMAETWPPPASPPEDGRP